MGIEDWFTFKSKDQREREHREYEKWSFPYGTKQKEKIQELLKLLLPKEDEKIALAFFFLCKEDAIGREYENPVYLSDEDIIKTADRFKNRLVSKMRADMSSYLTAVEADLKVDEFLAYPDLETLQERERQIEALLDR